MIEVHMNLEACLVSTCSYLISYTPIANLEDKI